MSGIDLDHLLHLAALQMTAGERELASRDLLRIMAMIDQMQAIPTDGVEPMASPFATRQRLRADIANHEINRELLQSTTASVEAGYYLVPRVIE